MIDFVKSARQANRADAYSALADLFSAGEDLKSSKLFRDLGLYDISPIAKRFLPSMLDSFMDTLEKGIPLAIFFAKLVVFLVDPTAEVQRWLKERRHEDLQELKEIDDPFEVLERLPLFLARDLKRHLARPDLPETQQRLIIIVDGYEHLVDARGRCQWLEQMMSQAEASPYILWVVLAETPPPEMTDALTIPVPALSEDICDRILQSVDIQHSAARQAITEQAQGSPLYLNTCINVWRHSRRIAREDLSQTLTDALKDEFETWEPYEYAAFRVLSVPNAWNPALFESLLQQFILGEASDDASLEALRSVVAASPYVESSEEEVSTLHPLVRQPLYDDQSTEQKALIHQYLYEHYQAQYSASGRSQLALKEAVYHGVQLRNSEPAINYALEQIAVQQQASPHPVLDSMLRCIIESGKATPTQTASAWGLSGQVLAALYEWQDAALALETALEHWHALDQDNSLSAATVWYELAEVYLNLDRTFDANRACQYALRIRTDLLGADAVDVARVLSRQAEVFDQQGDTQQAIATSDRAISILSAQAGIAPLELAEFKWTAATVRMTDYTLDQAIRYCREALETATKHGGAEHALTIKSQWLLGDIYREMGQRKWPVALEHYQQAGAAAESSLGIESAWTQTLLEAQIWLCKKLDQLEAAQTLASRLETAQQLDQGMATLSVADSLNRIGGTRYKKGEYGKAEPPFKQALHLRKQLLGDRHPQVASSLNNLAGLYRAQGRYDAAEPFYVQALELRRALLGDRHPQTQHVLENLNRLRTQSE